MDILALLDELRIMARNALPYVQDPYDHTRYTRILELVQLYYGAALDLPPADVRQRLAAELGRVTPKVGANAAIFDQHGDILLMCRSDSQQWCLPGGLVEVSETPMDTAVREAQEETGLACRPLQLVDFFTRPAGIHAGPHSLIAVVYLCEVIGGTLHGSPEGLEVRYWPLAEVRDWNTDHQAQARAAHSCWLARQTAA
ncbi:MAG: NUDIX domain-containing protein [Roseiflexaceae bacterium]